MKIVAIIPARYASSRLHGKVLLPIAGKPLIYHVYNNVAQTKEIDDVIVATDSGIVADECKKHGIKTMMTATTHTSGTSRVIEVAKRIDADIIINVQGDEPLIKADLISELIQTFSDENVEIATVKTLIKEPNMADIIDDENVVKVVCDKDGFAMYFSRATIPHKRSDLLEAKPLYYKAIGIYIYNKQTLLNIENMTISEYENIEMLEQLRWLYNGIKVKVIETDKLIHGVDTQEDFSYISKILS